MPKDGRTHLSTAHALSTSLTGTWRYKNTCALLSFNVARFIPFRLSGLSFKSGASWKRDKNCNFRFLKSAAKESELKLSEAGDRLIPKLTFGPDENTTVRALESVSVDQRCQKNTQVCLFKHDTKEVSCRYLSDNFFAEETRLSSGESAAGSVHRQDSTCPNPTIPQSDNVPVEILCRWVGGGYLGTIFCPLPELRQCPSQTMSESKKKIVCRGGGVYVSGGFFCLRYSGMDVRRQIQGQTNISSLPRLTNMTDDFLFPIKSDIPKQTERHERRSPDDNRTRTHVSGDSWKSQPSLRIQNFWAQACQNLISMNLSSIRTHTLWAAGLFDFKQLQQTKRESCFRPDTNCSIFVQLEFNELMNMNQTELRVDSESNTEIREFVTRTNLRGRLKTASSGSTSSSLPESLGNILRP